MISVIIPVCNEENYILNCINSLKNQEFKNFEIIIVCNGCTDKSEEIVKGKVSKVISVNERNIAQARNLGVKNSKGEILVFLDADSVLGNSALELISKNVKENLVGTFKIKPSSKKLKHKVMYSLKNKFLCPFGVSNGVVFCDRKAYDSVNGFDEKLKKREEGAFVRTIKRKGSFIILNDYIISSTRRFDKKGYMKSIMYWVKEALKPSEEEYEIIR